MEADAVTLQDIAPAVGDTVVHGAIGGGAERVCLVAANHEGGFGVRGGGRYCGDQLNGYQCGDDREEPTCDAHLLTAFLLRRTKLGASPILRRGAAPPPNLVEGHVIGVVDLRPPRSLGGIA